MPLFLLFLITQSVTFLSYAQDDPASLIIPQQQKLIEQEQLNRETEQNAVFQSEGSRLQTTEEQELFAKLKAKRLELAKAQNLPPYIIFHDTALIDQRSTAKIKLKNLKTHFQMTKVKPRPIEEMSNISGVGGVKLEKYG